MTTLAMLWNAEGGNLTCRWRELENDRIDPDKIQQSLSNEPHPSESVAARKSGSSAELNRAA